MPIGTVLVALVLGAAALKSAAVLYVSLNPNVTNKAGPEWMWRWGRLDPIRNAIYRQDGTFRHYSKPVVVAVSGVGLLASLVALSCLAWAIIA